MSTQHFRRPLLAALLILTVALVGLLQPAGWGHGPYDRRDTCSVPLYRTGNLDDLAASTDIDWQAVRSTPAGRRSPLAALPAARVGCPRQ